MLDGRPTASAGRPRLPQLLIGLLSASSCWLLACEGAVGTITVDLVTAPGSDLLERIERARLTLSNPMEVVEAERDEDGALSLSLEVVAEGETGAITVEGFDAGGARIALGLSPALPVTAIDAAITVYLAAPRSVDLAPVELAGGRAELGGARLPYGAVLAGGRDQDGAPVADLVIYNVYDHSLQIGLDLPAARAGVTILSGPSDFVYLFGGIDDDGEPAADAWRFDTSIAPAGAYLTLLSAAGLARAGQSGAYAGNETFLVTGMPPARIDPSQVAALADEPSAPDAVAVSLPSSAPVQPVLVLGAEVGDTGAAIFDGNALRELEAPPEVLRAEHDAVLLPDGRVLLVGGYHPAAPTVVPRAAVLYDPAEGVFTAVADFLEVGRYGAAVTATLDVVIVAGGYDDGGVARADAELFDARSLEPMGTVALASERVRALALPLANRQVLIAGGSNGSNQPLATLELFTPDR